MAHQKQQKLKQRW